MYNELMSKTLQEIRNKYPVFWLGQKHHMTHKGEKLNFFTHKYLTEIYLDNSEYLVIIKSTQNGISEYLLVRALSHAINGMRVFYVLPTFELVKRFVDERFGKSILYTPFYKKLAAYMKETENLDKTDSVKSKDFGGGNIAFVNSGSSVGFTEYPADETIIDEMDKCDPSNIKMAWERLSHSEYRWQTKISNPTFNNYAIDKEYRNTNQKEWFIKCDCGHYINMDWFKHVVMKTDEGKYIIRDKEWSWDSKNDIRPICDKCGRPLNRHQNGAWVPLNPGKQKTGYRLTKLFSGTVSMVDLLNRFMEGLKDDEEMQRFYNADLGRAFTATGATITRDMLEKCVSDMTVEKDGVILSGIDVGKYYHYVIIKMLPNGKIYCLKIGKEKDTDQMINILRQYKISAGVIDGLPETREARKIANKFPFMFLCYYGGNKKDSIDLPGKTITVQRTPAIDAVKEALLTNTLLYPHNVINNDEFIKHMTSSVRVFNATKRTGNQQGAYEWIEDGADHFLHASAYSLIARRLVVLLRSR